MNKTTIEWVKNPDGTQGYTWNPITGCLNGCDYCYARKLANGRLKSRYLVNLNVAPGYGNPLNTSELLDPFYPRFWVNRLFEPVNKERRWGRQSRVIHVQEPKGIFVCDMSDLFGVGVPEEWTRRVLDRFQYAPQHRFYLLTKQPQNLAKFSPFPDNCWVGVTVCNQEMANEAIPILMNVNAKVRYVSVEPMLSPIDLTKIVFGHYALDNKPYYVNACEDRYIFGDEGNIELKKIDWLIIGAQTKPYKPPRIEWVKEILGAADKASIPVFTKDNLKPLLEEAQIPLRQEIPE